MALPPWLEPKITLGNILTIVPLIGAILAIAQAYGALGERVAQHTAELLVMERVDQEIRAAAVSLATAISADKLATRESLVELKTDVGYIRRFVEEERRKP